MNVDETTGRALRRERLDGGRRAEEAKKMGGHFERDAVEDDDGVEGV